MSSNPSLDSEWTGSHPKRSRREISDWDRMMMEKYGWTEEQIKRWAENSRKFLKMLGERAEAYIASTRNGRPAKPL